MQNLIFGKNKNEFGELYLSVWEAEADQNNH